MKEKTMAHINFSSKSAGVSPGFAGLGFFLLCIYYFGYTNLVDCSIWEILFQMLMPMAILAAFTVLWQMKRYNSFPVYSIMGCVYCLLMLIRTFSYSSIILMIVEILLYLLAAYVCFASATGKNRNYRYMTGALLIPVVLRLVYSLFAYVFTLSLFALIAEVAALCGLAAFGFVVKCIKE